MYVVTLTKLMKKWGATQSRKANENTRYVVDRALKGSRGTGWTAEIVKQERGPKINGVYTIRRSIRLEKKSGKQDEATQWKEIYRFLVQAAQSQLGGKWNVECPQAPPGDEYEVPAPTIILGKGDVVKDYAQICIEPQHHFDHLFGLEYHIQRTLAALRLAQTTELQKRIHTVFIGPPGCGKTDLTLAIGEMLGKENEAWLKFDATATTQAGALHKLLNSRTIPPVLILEEAEKTPEAAARWLLGVLDKRGEVRQTNFRVGNLCKNVKMICIATVNDEEKFRDAMSGALASRFANKIYFGRPPREVMQKILEREVRSINGNMAWVEPTLVFCMDQLHWNDPREIIPICLCGQDQLLDQSYQKAVLNTLPPHSKKDYKP